MKTSGKKQKYDPEDFAIFGEFDFDMDLSFKDYAYLCSYWLVVYPFILLARLLAMPVSLLRGKKDSCQHNEELKRGTTHKRHHVINSRF